MTTLNTSILAASFLAAGLGFAGLAEGGAQAQAGATVANDNALYSARLEEAFRLAGDIAIDEAIVKRVATAARKSDRLASSADCEQQAWPNLSSDCLMGPDGLRSGPLVRTVTVEYRVGDSTSVLVRLPSPQIAGR